MLQCPRWAQKFRSGSPVLSMAAVAGSVLLAVAAVWLCHRIALANSAIDYVPTNGTFQTYNPQRRLFDGQVIGRDFPVYLGIGPTLLVHAGMRLVGPTLADCNYVTSLLCVISSLLCSLVLARFCGLGWPGSIMVAVAFAAAHVPTNRIWLVDLLGYDQLQHYIFQSTHANSNLPLRAAAPFIAALALAAGRRAVGNHAARMIVVTGVVAGLASIWSNDYGPATSAAVGLHWWLTTPASGWRRFAAFALLVSLALATAALAVTAVTHGHPLAWFNQNLGVSEDQFWYFGGFKILRLSDLPFSLWDGAALVIGAALAVRLATRTAAQGEEWLLLVLTASLAASWILMFGAINPNYSVPMHRVVLFAGAYLFCRAVRFVHWPTGVRWVAISAALLACIAVMVKSRRGVALLTMAPGASAGDIDVPELGGRFTPLYQSVVAIGREWKERPGGPPHVFSTYASALEAIAGTDQPTGCDYIIHALGTELRRRYLDYFRDSPPEYAVTVRASCSLRPEWLVFEPWVRAVNWDFYRALIPAYRPVEQGPFMTIWERRTEQLPPCEPTPILRRQVTGDSRQAFYLSLQSPDPADSARTYLVEVEIDFDVAWNGQRWKTGGLRQYVHIDCPRQFSPLHRIGVPIGRGPVRFPIEVGVGREVEFNLIVEPAESSRLTVRSATARCVIAKDAIDDFLPERIRAESRHDAEWRRGIWIGASSRAGFVLAEGRLLDRLPPGARMRFAASGIRRVVEVVGQRVWLEGPPLDPERDGFPHAIEILPPAVAIAESIR